ncbi:MAG: SWIM zinc finger family protein [Synechococcales bacterium]|nr:SWIM zinc finger family protein [Synechococcales bacterium]
MTAKTRTWWGQQFLSALEQFTDPGRLSRGRAYASGTKVKSFTIEDGIVTAQVRGSINPYYGVYSEPLYSTTLEFEAISDAKWAAVLAVIASKAGLISRLLLGEMPETIEEPFETLGIHLLPQSRRDFQSYCTCPDWENPCKHVAGVYYLLAGRLDQDPFLLFELRGLSKETLYAELAKSPLGKALAADIVTQNTEPEPVPSYYITPERRSPDPDPNLRDFWLGTKRLPPAVEPPSAAGVPAVLVKKQGDFPAFWQRDNSFIEAMEELYERVRNHHRSIL